MPAAPRPTPPARAERIAKRLARAGLCSRREAERWIAEGRVKVDGRILDTPAVVVTKASRIEVDGRPLRPAAPARLFRYHKPPGVIVTRSDPQGRPTLFDRLPPGMPRLHAVGRLDLGSEGLILLTNDGALKRHLELPTTGWARRYRVRVFGDPEREQLERLARGITVGGVAYGAIHATLERRRGANAWIAVTLREGRNREIRRVMEAMGWTVNRLIRVAYGPFQLGALKRDEIVEVPGKVLREQLGHFLENADPRDVGPGRD